MSVFERGDWAKTSMPYVNEVLEIKEEFNSVAKHIAQEMRKRGHQKSEVHLRRIVTYILQNQLEPTAQENIAPEAKGQNNTTWQEGKDNATFTYKGVKRITTLDQAVEVSGADLKVWEVDRFIFNKWEQNSNEKGTTDLIQVKVWFKKRKVTLDTETIKQEIKNDLKLHSPYIPKKSYKNQGDNLLAVNIFDLHLDKTSYEAESGDSYDSKIASERFIDALHGLVEMAEGIKFDRILFVVGQDFFNSDRSHPFPQTTAGTPQDSDLRWKKSFKTGRVLICDGIDYLSRFAPVDVVVIPGNHDTERSFYLGDVLECKYENNQNVSIDNGHKSRKYYKYGKNLIGLTHGDKEKPADLPQLMAQEQPIWWSETTSREWLLGHLHHEKVKERQSTKDYMGVIVRYLPSLSSTDQWHHSKGFIGAKKAAKSIVYNLEHGKIAEFNFNVISNS